MEIAKFAFLTQIEENLYEVFHVLPFEINSDTYARWKNGFSGPDVVCMDAGALEEITLGDVWDGASFTGGSGTHVNFNDQDVFVFLSEGKVFAHMSIETGSELCNKFHAAHSNKVIGLDITDNPYVDLGYTWDTEIFHQPE
jgi:hypothetical protein